MGATLVQLNVSKGASRSCRSNSARVHRASGVDGDAQKNLKYHGGPNRAVCLYSTELYAQLRAEGIDVDSGGLRRELHDDRHRPQRAVEGRPNPRRRLFDRDHRRASPV
jgi:hypothetical protein